MHKRAPYDFPIHDLLSERWSPRAFADKSVEPDVLASLFEAARWAPSGSNEQPWSYLVATRDDPENFSKLLSVLVPSNAVWAKNAPVLALAVAAVKFAKTGKDNHNAQYDTGAATAMLCIEATSRGLFVHPNGGIRRRQDSRSFRHTPRLRSARYHRYRFCRRPRVCRNRCAIANFSPARENQFHTL